MSLLAAVLSWHRLRVSFTPDWSSRYSWFLTQSLHVEVISEKEGIGFL